MLRSGENLIKEISDSKPDDGIFLWWLGQHSFIVRTPESIIYIDPFLSDHGKRLIPPLVDPEQIVNADLILGTHNHRDHIDREVWPAIAAASPTATFVVPEFHRTGLIDELGFDSGRILGINAGDDLRFADIRINAIPSAHEFLDCDEQTGLYPFLGYVLNINGFVLYHSGDTCLYNGLSETLTDFDIDLALLPINGRDAARLTRNCIGNMTFQEAADLTGGAGIKAVVPTHFDMFPGNREDPGLFIDYVKIKYPDVNAFIMRYGEKISFNTSGKS